MTTDIVIPACDEADTVGDVVTACLGAPSAGIVTVVVNGTDNGTSVAAGNAGAYVTTRPEADKGAAMRQGLRVVLTGTVLFCDADLIGLTSGHVEAMCNLGPLEGQLAGLTDRRVTRLSRLLPPITGQRRLPTDFAKLLPLAGSGYEAEMRINAAVGKAGLPHKTVLLRGVTNPTRAAVSPWRFAKMVGSVATASLYLSLELLRYEANPTGSGTCSKPTRST